MTRAARNGEPAPVSPLAQQALLDEHVEWSTMTWAEAARARLRLLLDLRRHCDRTSAMPEPSARAGLVEEIGDAYDALSAWHPANRVGARALLACKVFGDGLPVIVTDTKAEPIHGEPIVRLRRCTPHRDCRGRFRPDDLGWWPLTEVSS